MRTVRTTFLAFMLFLPAAVGAQDNQGNQTVLLSDPAPPSWDVTGHMAWLTVDNGPGSSSWNRWYDVASVGASAGRFFGRHLKLEFDVATSASADLYVDRTFTLPTQPYPIYYAQRQEFRMTTLSGGASYQFLDNRWFHPVVGVGLEAARETRTIDADVLGAVPPAAIPVDPPGTTVSWRNRPFTAIGFKWFVSERAFVRSDVRTTFDSGGLAQLSWRTGFGVDF
jgi:hypothetical protein